MKKLNTIIVVIITLLVYANNGYAATLSGKVIDAETAEPLFGITVTYYNEEYDVDRVDSTDPNGIFSLTNLPAGIGEIKARPNVSTGYAWNLPWPSNWIYLSAGQTEANRIIALQKGVLVSGYVKDSIGNPISGAELSWEGRTCEGWNSYTDLNGYYEIRLPLGEHLIDLYWYDETLTCLPQEVTIANINQAVNVDDIIAYSDVTGGNISGTVSNPSGYSKTGEFAILAFEAGTSPDPNAHYFPVINNDSLPSSGVFSISALPQGINYDIYLCVYNEANDLESLVVHDYQQNIAIGTNDINLYYNSEGSTVTGNIINTAGMEVFGTNAILMDAVTDSFIGYVEVNQNGIYTVHNVPAGIYNVATMHSKYHNASTTVEVLDGVAANVNTIVMPFVGEKEGADLNGDGMVNMVDFAKFANQWGQSGLLDANFDQQGTVDFVDLLKVTDNWLWKAIWYNE